MLGTQLPLAYILTGLSSSNTTIGFFGEMWLANHLEQSGYKVATNHKWRRGDLQIFLGNRQSVYIEVKTARQTTDGNWRFRLLKNDKYGATDHRRTDFVSLLCITKRGAVVPFIIPTSELRKQTNVCICTNPRTYAGKFARFRQSINRLSLNVETIQ